MLFCFMPISTAFSDHSAGPAALCQLLGTRHPIVQGGMVWCTNADLVIAVGQAGGLGTLGAGSMYPAELREEIAAVKAGFDGTFAVNVPLLYPAVEEHMQTIVEMGVPVVITSAGSPKKWTKFLKDRGIIVVHVVSSAAFAVKSVAAGVDAVVAEGFEAGGHNGREETTTLCLVPEVVAAVDVPVIAAGGISCGRTMMAALALGAAGVQMGSRFVATAECPAHEDFKAHVLAAAAGSTKLRLKGVTPVRMLDNTEGGFSAQVAEAEARSASPEALRELLGRGRAKRGMRGGDLVEGELEIGQVSARLDNLPQAGDVVRDVVAGYEALRTQLSGPSFHWS
jgi:enoyl-[acyl-carrier protein] reductase II